MSMNSEIQHLVERGRFQAIVEGRTCVADYRLADGVMMITHTEVPEPLEGQGIAAELTKAAIDYARQNGLKVRPLCSYARSYMARNPDTADVRA